MARSISDNEELLLLLDYTAENLILITWEVTEGKSMHFSHDWEPRINQLYSCRERSSLSSAFPKLPIMEAFIYFRSCIHFTNLFSSSLLAYFTIFWLNLKINIFMCVNYANIGHYRTNEKSMISFIILLSSLVPPQIQCFHLPVFSWLIRGIFLHAYLNITHCTHILKHHIVWH